MTFLFGFPDLSLWGIYPCSPPSLSPTLTSLSFFSLSLLVDAFSMFLLVMQAPQAAYPKCMGSVLMYSTFRVVSSA